MVSMFDGKIQEFQKFLPLKPAGSLIGHKLYYFPKIDSTNDEAYRLGIAGAHDGAVVLADSQTQGKGRMQRVWHSPAGSNIYTSIILRPQFEPARAPQISLVAGVAVAELLEHYCPGRIELKWPNDVLVEGRKICGILAQMKTAGEEIDFVVVGIGINVNIQPNCFPEEIREIATSLIFEAGRVIDRKNLISNLYENFEKWYEILLKSGFKDVKNRWLSLAPMIGKNVQIIFQDEKIIGKAMGLNDDGSLIILTKGAKELKISAGDATILKKEL
jgi:BirA family biotin operon repressor/biotin-[acetyl-CoA-carboxylase] ligase